MCSHRIFAFFSHHEAVTEVVLDFLGLNNEFSRLFLNVIFDWWWLAAPPFLVFVFLDLWIYMKEWEFIRAIDWVLLEVRLPKEVLRTPKAMEQTFAGIHGIFNPTRWDQTLLLGLVNYWFSFEFVGTGGQGMRFFIRTPTRFRKVVESNIYAHYPEVEIVEAQDYVHTVPPRIPNETYDLWGTELALMKKDAYPIRSYLEFEAQVEEQRLDPIAAIAEAMNSLRPGEHIWIQILCGPAKDDWKEDGTKLIKELWHSAAEKKKGAGALPLGDVSRELGGLVGGVAGEMLGIHPVAGEKKKEERPPPLPAMLLISPGERKVVEAIEMNISKLGFDSRIRWVYIARRDVFNGANIAAITGFFKQFNTLNMNGFKYDANTRTYVRRWLKARREYLRKLRILPNYRRRRMYMAGTFMKKNYGKFVLNIEELASLYHFPGKVVMAPLMPRVEARRGEPPASLPIE